MQAKLILSRPDGSKAQVAITADATASVSDLAHALAASDPKTRSGRPGSNLTLKLEHAAFDKGSQGRLLEPARSLIDSGLRSGSTVSIASSTGAVAAPQRRKGRAVAVLRVLEGPDAGLEFPLPAGNSSIGSGRGNDVVLSDPGVADVHAALAIGESIDIASLGGPSGVRIAGQPVQRATVGATDVVQLAGTSVAVLPTVRPGTTQTDSVAIEFNRSPRVVARFDEQELPAPKPPQLPGPTHFPVVSMLAPLVMGLVMYAVTRSMLSVVFIALSPLLMIGMYFDTKMQERRQYRHEVTRFSDALRAMAETLTDTQRVERAVRSTEAPALNQVIDAIHRLGPLLWTHRPELPGFLTVRLGLGDAPSRCRITLSDTESAEVKYAQQLHDLRDEFATVTEVPIVADLRSCGALGISGPRGIVDGVARGVIIQLAGLHSPAELTITAFSSPQSRASWEWLEWMPHTGSAYSPLSGNHLTDSENGGQALMARLEDLVKARRSDDGPGYSFGPLTPQAAETHAPTRTPAVVVLVEDTAPIDRARLTRLAEQGAAVGVHLIWVATQVSSLPSACRTFLLVENASDGATVGQVRQGRHSFPVAADSVEVADARQIALLLAPVVDAGAVTADDTDLPRAVSYLGLTGTRVATDPAAIAQQWVANDSVLNRNGAPRVLNSPAGLGALVGSGGSQQVHLDLREHGPHALVGGTTGSGKSEFLQTWITGMAAAHSPDRISFLLVDYKGGTAFADCVALPHTVGLVTDLSPHLVRRALTSLGAEIRRREHLLNDKRAKDLVSLEQTGDPDTPPALVIIVDEFAALASEVPEFVDGVIDVAQRGRSLGLHLVLATQRPAGVIKDNLRANTNLRIALRLNDVDDSVDVIDEPLAAYFPPEIPGRAVAKTGPGRLTTFQAAYVGGRTSEQPEQSPIDIWEFVFGRRRPWVDPSAGAAAAPKPSGPTDIARITANIGAAAEQLSIPLPRKPWLTPLAGSYALESLAAESTGREMVLGRGDIPSRQAQPIATFSPDDAGNMAIVGTGGSGKSAALRTLAITAALNPHDGPVHVYAIDFASGSLTMLETLPHVAAVVSADDEERIGRVLRRLTALLDERIRTYSRVNASTITEYRQLGNPNEPRILLLLDAIGPFREQYEHTSHTPFFTMLSQLASDGRAVGIHVIITADRPNAISMSLASTIQRRLVLRLASDDDYLMAGVPSDILSANSPAGRGIIEDVEYGNIEVQVGVLGGDANVAVQARAIEHLAQRMRASSFVPPEPIQRLSEHIELDALPVDTGTGGAVIGVADETLSPLGINAAGVFMLTGPPGSGRSTALVTLAQSVRRQQPGTRIVHVAPAPSNIASQQVWDRSAIGVDAVRAAIGELSFASGRIMLVIENVADFGDTDVESDLAQLIKTLGDNAFVVGESEVSRWGQAWQLAQPFKSARRGLVLWPNGSECDGLLSTSIGMVRRTEFPPGRGVLVERGKGVWLQVAQPVI